MSYLNILVWWIMVPAAIIVAAWPLVHKFRPYWEDDE